MHRLAVAVVFLHPSRCSKGGIYGCVQQVVVFSPQDSSLVVISSRNCEFVNDLGAGMSRYPPFESHKGWGSLIRGGIHHERVVQPPSFTLHLVGIKRVASKYSKSETSSRGPFLDPQRLWGPEIRKRHRHGQIVRASL
jgi:hypothetical protein